MPPTEGSPEGTGQPAGALTSRCTWALAAWKRHFPRLCVSAKAWPGLIAGRLRPRAQPNYRGFNNN